MKEQDTRVKADIFPVSSFLISLITFGIITTIQMKILGNYIDVSQIAPVHVILVLILWLLVAATFTILTSYQIRKRYQKPIEDFAEAARKVAAGDFSVYLAPRHSEDKLDYLDVLFLDFNKMVEELGLSLIHI